VSATFSVSSKASATPTGLYGGGNGMSSIGVTSTSDYAAVLVDGGTGVRSLFVTDLSGGAVIHNNTSSPTADPVIHTSGVERSDGLAGLHWHSGDAARI
jgi:hypothetical protein